jgi:hypothetical protein
MHMTLTTLNSKPNTPTIPLTNIPVETRGHQIVWVTPAMAQAWLVHNTRNRNKKPRAISAYARDMANGDWEYNGETLKFSKTGVLLDGQNRLYAIIQSGATVEILVVTGLRDKAQETMDANTRRYFYDTLDIRQEIRTKEVAALCRKVNLLYLAGLKAALVGDAGENKGGQPTTAELSAVLEANPAIRQYAEPSKRIGRIVHLPGSVVGLMMFVLDQVDAEDADYFFRTLETGEMLSAGHPIHTLRQALQNAKFSNRKEDTAKAGAYIIKAWNKYRAGESLQSLSFRPGGANPEPFPLPR